MGVIEDAAKAVGLALKPEHDLIVIGASKGELGRSLWLREILGQETGAPPPIDLTAERRNGEFVRAQILSGKVAACHDVSDGGLLVAVAEMALAGDTGVDLTAPETSTPSGSARNRRAMCSCGKCRTAPPFSRRRCRRASRPRKSAAPTATGN